MSEAPLRFDGVICYGLPFADEHLRNPNYLDWLRDYDVIRTLNLPSYWEPVTEDEVKRYCRNVMASDTDKFFALHAGDSGRFIGTVRLGHIDWTGGIGDIGIMIGERQYWGRGIAQDAVSAVAKLAFSRLRLRKLTAGAMSINPAMIHVFEKLGFQREACLRQHDRLREGGYCDHIHLGCFRDEFEGAITSALRSGKLQNMEAK
ncbi:MAG: GNAT family N-acetyltransferase [Pseudomonadales bacterium]|nr:GNAT family N-acetyltransferase [Pseudomonadales bacterium]